VGETVSVHLASSGEAKIASEKQVANPPSTATAGCSTYSTRNSQNLAIHPSTKDSESGYLAGKMTASWMLDVYALLFL
jgi:hypothetical protein